MIFTIGHSSHRMDDFVRTLESVGTVHLLDVRTHPRSRWPWFTRANLQAAGQPLFEAGIGYRWETRLAGWNDKHAKADPAVIRDMARVGVDLSLYAGDRYPKYKLNQPWDPASAPVHHGWTRRAEYDYQWFTAMHEFRMGIKILDLATNTGEPFVLMCSEYNWTKCHRAQIADALTHRGHQVTHLRVGEAPEPHDITRWDRYSTDVLESWR